MSKVQLRWKGCDPRRHNFQLLLPKFETSTASPPNTHSSAQLKFPDQIWQIFKSNLSLSSFGFVEFFIWIDLGISNFLHHSTESNLKVQRLSSSSTTATFSVIFAIAVIFKFACTILFDAQAFSAREYLCFRSIQLVHQLHGVCHYCLYLTWQI